MAGINKVILIGRLGRDPEISYTASGQAVARLSLATSEEWRDKATGEKKERTEWHRIVVWGKQGENCGAYLAKGRQIYVEGRLQTREWEDKEGNKRYITEIIAGNVTFLGGGGNVPRDNYGDPSNVNFDDGGDMGFPHPHGGEGPVDFDDVPF